MDSTEMTESNVMMISYGPIEGHGTTREAQRIRNGFALSLATECHPPSARTDNM